ncbi:MAG: hypothetical protein KGH66_02735 [Candidatus Micrarchaeota archaeon]|nr:hypothetical protein [Candidatus Micrarchaeota archaeon]
MPVAYPAPLGQLNVTQLGGSNFSLHLDLPNANTLISPSNFMALTAIRVTGSGANAIASTASVSNYGYLASHDVNVTITPGSGIPPFTADVMLMIGPDTPSGSYGVLITANGIAYAPANSTIILNVYNPTNATISRPANASSLPERAVSVSYVNASNAQSSNPVVGNTPSTTTVQQAPHPATVGGFYRYAAAAIIIAIVIAAAYLFLRKRK